MISLAAVLTAHVLCNVTRHAVVGRAVYGVCSVAYLILFAAQHDRFRCNEGCDFDLCRTCMEETATFTFGVYHTSGSIDSMW